jgi:hypothetical protein
MAGMTAEQALEAAKGMTFEKMWALLMETRERMDQTGKYIAEMSAKVDRTTENIERMGARVDQTSARVAETTINVDNMAAKVDRITANVGGLNRSVGELIETLIAARLWEKFDGYNYNFKRVYQRVPIYDNTDRLRSDIDILLSNTKWCMAVEVKHEADNKDVDQHLKRMQLIKQYPPMEVSGKKLLGAIAGGVIPPDVQEYAFKAGFYVFELTGESVCLVQPPTDFKAQEW